MIYVRVEIPVIYVAPMMIVARVAFGNAAAIGRFAGGGLVPVTVGLTTFHRGLASEAHYA
jgi:hypothetical protein